MKDVFLLIESSLRVWQESSTQDCCRAVGVGESQWDGVNLLHTDKHEQLCSLLALIHLQMWGRAWLLCLKLNALTFGWSENLFNLPVSAVDAIPKQSVTGAAASPRQVWVQSLWHKSAAVPTKHTGEWSFSERWYHYIHNLQYSYILSDKTNKLREGTCLYPPHLVKNPSLKYELLKVQNVHVFFLLSRSGRQDIICVKTPYSELTFFGVSAFGKSGCESYSVSLWIHGRECEHIQLLLRLWRWRRNTSETLADFFWTTGRNIP